MSLVPTVSAAIAPVTDAIVAPVIMVTAVTGEGVVGRTASLPGKALARGDEDRENADCQQQQSNRPSDWDHLSLTRAGVARRGIGDREMTSVPDASMATTIVGVTAIAIVPRVATIAAPASGLPLRALSWRRKDHAPKDKRNRSGKDQQQNSDVHPSGCSHPSLPLFPRLGHQFNSTKRM